MSRGYPLWRLLHAAFWRRVRRTETGREGTPLTSKSLRRWSASCLSLLFAWIALVGSLELLELAVGVGAAVVGAVVAAAVRRFGAFPPLVVRRRAWSRAVVGLARIPLDLWLLARRGLRSKGSLSVVDLPAGTDWRHRAERGFAELFGSLAPNTIVLECSADGTAWTHQLVETDAGPLP